MLCSAVTLSLATISAIVATALLAIAFSTDNWLYVDVDRLSIKTFIDRATLKGHQDPVLVEQYSRKYYYYTRTKGLFRICFPKKRPTTVDTYLSPLETHCTNIDYFITNTDNRTKDFNDYAMTKLHMGRSAIALFIVSFFVVFIAFWTGVAGCWRRSPGNITATAILILLSCLLSAGAMGFWHGVEYYEKERRIGEEYYQEWNNVLKDSTKMWYDWSFYLAWTGIGFTLASAILFSGAAICLKGERQREEAVNMQYLMPVYPQKQPYPYTGYPTSPTAYPAGPYYHGSQYGLYNY